MKNFFYLLLMTLCFLLVVPTGCSWEGEKDPSETVIQVDEDIGPIGYNLMVPISKEYYDAEVRFEPVFSKLILDNPVKTASTIEYTIKRPITGLLIWDYNYRKFELKNINTHIGTMNKFV